MSGRPIPWDGPSRFGAGGRLARRALKRGLRPLLVRQDALQAMADARLQAIEGELATAAQARDELTGRLAAEQAGAARDARRLDDLALLTDGLLAARLPHDGELRLHPAGAPQRRAIVSLGTGAHHDLLARSSLGFERYAARHGWDLVLSTGTGLAAGRPPAWGKVPLLQRLLDDYDLLLWLDADIAVVDLAPDVAAQLPADKDLGLVEHAWGEHTANSGVLLLRASDWSRALLQAMWDDVASIEHPWWENAALLKLLGYELAPARLVEPTSWLARTAFVDRRFNSIPVDRAERPVFVHRGFFSPEVRAAQVTADLRCVLADAAPITAGFDAPARSVRRIEDVRRREDLPLALNALGLTGTGVEVGVRKGHFSEWLLDLWDGELLLSVDPWQADEQERYVDISNVSQDEHDWNAEETRRRLRRFGARSQLRRATGEQAAATLTPGSLDLVYLDARHDEPSVAEDLRCWWPLVRPGGVIAGHDYLDGDIPAGVFGVRSAVDAFFAAEGLPVHATVDDEPWPSWVVRKPADA